MVRISVDLISSFEELYYYWKKAERVQTPFRAILLSTEIAGLDKKVTDFVLNNVGELKDMSGKSCAMFMVTPRKFIDLPQKLEAQYKEISYSIGRLLQVPPAHFPAIVFFDVLTHPKQMVLVSLAPILGQEPTDEELVHFFRTLFTITDELADIPDEKRLAALQDTIIKKWGKNKKQNKNFARIIETTVSLSEIAKNITPIIADVLNSIRALYGPP